MLCDLQYMESAVVKLGWCLTMLQDNSTRGRASKKASLIFFPSRSGKTVDRPEPTLCTTMS